MKQTILFYSLILLSFSFKAQTPNFEWAHSVGGSGEDRIFNISVDYLGNVITVGYFKDTVDFDPSISGNYNMVANGSRDGFIQKLDSDGNFMWAIGFGDINNTTVNCVTTLLNGDILVAGSFSDTIDFDPGVNVTTLISQAVTDGFILKLSPQGEFIWVKQLSSSSYMEPLDIEIKNSQIYLTGTFAGTADFDPDLSTFNLISNLGGYEHFVLKLNESGGFIWAKATSGTNGYSQRGNSLVIDGQSNIYTTGWFDQTVDFDPGVGVFNMISVGMIDVFVQKLDSNGNFLWAKSMGGVNTESGYSISLDENNNPVISGRFRETVDFDPGVNVLNYTSNGGFDMFILKLSALGDLIWAKQIGGANTDQSFSIVCDNLGNNYIAGNFYGNIDVDPGIGDYFIDNTTRNDAYMLILKLNSAGDFLWATTTGINITNSISIDNNNIIVGGYFAGTVDADPRLSVSNLVSNGVNDCSVVKFSQCSFTTSTINPSSCYSYVSPSGNNNWTVSGTYIDTIPNAGGCDSVITINLTIDTIVSTTTVSGNIITTDESGATYQWLDCDNAYAYVGAVNQDFTATVNGNYAVEITKGSCIDTSACINISTVGVEDILNVHFSIYPNPTSGKITIDTGEYELGFKYSILSIEGKVIQTGKSTTNIKTIDLSKLNKGIYILEVNQYDKNISYKLFKQ